MTQSTAQQQIAQRVDRLIRSLVGVVDLAPSWNEHGRLTGIDILKHVDVQEHQLVRNVVSGLGAGCGIKLARAAVRVHIDASAFAEVSAAAAPRAAHTPEDLPAGPSAAAQQNGNGKVHAATNGNGNGNGNGKNGGALKPAARGIDAGRPDGPVRAPTRNGTVAARRQIAVRDSVRQRAADEAARISARALKPEERALLPADTGEELCLERIHLERHGPLLRCRVTLMLNAHRYSAIADAPDSPTAEAELAARVTLDALRAGNLTDAKLEGVGFTTINDTTFVAASIRVTRADVAQAGTAPLLDSMAYAATLAVLNAVGPLTSVHREAGERELSRL
jgi:hypothetical protein